MTQHTPSRRGLAAAALLSIALAAPAAAETTDIRVGYSTLFNTGFHLYMGEVAPEIYEKHGIKLVPVDMKANAANCIAAMFAGDVDMCSVSTPSGTFATVEGAPLKAVAVLQGPLTQLYLSKAAAEKTGVSPEAPPKERLRGIKGLDLVTSAPGTLYYNILEQMLRDVGLSVSDVRYRTLVDQVAMKEGLSNGTFQAVLWSAGAFADLEKSGAVLNWVSVPGGDLPELAALPTVTVFTLDKWLEAHPGKAEDLHAAFVDVIATLKAEPAKYSGLIKAKNYPDMNQVVWDNAFDHGLAVLWDKGTVAEKGWSDLVAMQKANNPDKDFSSVEWSKIVLPVAQAK